MALHKIGGVEGMLCHSTSIDLIDIRCQQRLAYFSWVYLESAHCGWTALSQASHLSCFAFLASFNFLGAPVLSCFQLDQSFYSTSLSLSGVRHTMTKWHVLEWNATLECLNLNTHMHLHMRLSARICVFKKRGDKGNWKSRNRRRNTINIPLSYLSEWES